MFSLRSIVLGLNISGFDNFQEEFHEDHQFWDQVFRDIEKSRSAAMPVGPNDMGPKLKIVVCGGNGFLGSRICKAAVARGWEVTSVSRSGQPVWRSVTTSSTAPAWSKSVKWERADILKPSQYAPLLKDSDAVVHSMGILLEADYKDVISGRESIIAGLQRAFSTKKLGTQNPLERKDDEDLRPQEKDGQLTYEVMNRDSAIVLAQVAAKWKVPTFCYISAAGGAPVLPQRYIDTKRDAESAIASNFPRMRSFFVRPGMLYDVSRKITIPLAAATGLGYGFNGLTRGTFAGFLGAAAAKPLHADLVAEAVVEAISDTKVKGPVDTQEIEELAQKAWRRGML